MLPHQERVVAERDELKERAARLSAFFDAPVFGALPVSEQVRMRLQEAHMNAYREVLDERIAAFS